ncbi:ATP-grasp fold amidoligase family protein [Clostridium paraputrificum]|uniref:ATP-grasp fold amidoligase family protein n=1 Tax=Clostridium paraputrificum TaxID=29363 RepID=UPI0006841F39|nr:ATP-grasp fold amidoligase family protein [Clostridium paraputrificum]
MKCRILLKVIFTKIFKKFPKLITDEKHSKLLFWIMFGYIPDLKHPKTMNEYICASKIKDDKLEYWKYTDKYEVRKYVEKTIGSKYLNNVIGIYDSFDEINFEDLPNKFALKATHGSSYNVIVKNKNKLNKFAAKKSFDKWLKENFYYKDREKNYKNIKPRIMCDVFLQPQDGELEEYKLFCFKGKVGFIQHNKEIGKNRYSNIFSPEWELLGVKYGYSGFENDKKPNNGDELVFLAEKLAKLFEFVRVDLYNVDGRIVFSELTFHSGGGLIPFNPKEYDRKFGELLGL